MTVETQQRPKELEENQANFQVPDPAWKQEQWSPSGSQEDVEAPVSQDKLEMLYNLSQATSPEAKEHYEQLIRELPDNVRPDVYEYMQSRKNPNEAASSFPEERVTPERVVPFVPLGELSEEMLEKIHNLGSSDNKGALETFGMYLNALTPEQADQFGSYRAKRILSERPEIGDARTEVKNAIEGAGAADSEEVVAMRSDLAEVSQAQEPAEIARAYEPEPFSNPGELPNGKGIDSQAQEWASGAKQPGLWSRLTRRFRRRK